jgi:adenylate kinase
MLNIVLFGAPGTGKGTQSGLLMEKYRLVHFSTGDMMRRAIKEGTLVGQEAKKYIDKGMLVPDEIIVETVDYEMTKYKEKPGFVFDGFPRTLPQADALDIMLKQKYTPIALVFFLEVDERELMQRILNRSKQGDRTDDTEEIVNKRISVYQEQTLPLLDYYRRQGKCITINGMNGIEDVFAQICENIDYYKNTRS